MRISLVCYLDITISSTNRSLVKATVEAFYHSVTILAQREVDQGVPTEAGLVNAIEELSAQRILSILGSNIKDQLSMLHIIPFAASAALSVNCRLLQQSRLPTSRARAREMVSVNLEVLKGLSEKFWIAEEVKKVGKQVLETIDTGTERG